MTPQERKAIRVVECGCCGAYHPEDFTGDCRDDVSRLYDVDGQEYEIVSTVEEQMEAENDPK